MSVRRARGFNLIELMIVVAIIAILTVVALPGFSGMLQNSNTRSAADSIENGIRFAQAEAVRLGRIVTFTPTSTGGWTVTYTQITGADSGSNILQTQPSTYSSSVSLPTTTAISFNGLGRVGIGTSTFSNATGTTRFTPATTDPAVIYQINNSRGSRKLSVWVSPSGKIRMCDPDRTYDVNNAPDGCPQTTP